METGPSNSVPGYIRRMALSDEKYIRVTTFKKDGTEVSTPTWVVALEDGKIGFYTSSTSGKAQRLKNNPNVIVQASDGRGRPKSDTLPLKGTAVVVSGPERDAIRLTDRFTADQRAQLLKLLTQNGIGCNPYFSPIHLQKYYRDELGHREGELPVTEKIGQRSFAIPFSTKITESQVDYVCETLKKLIGQI
jgi:PPOX class probable F420-dependent enzyme